MVPKLIVPIINGNSGTTQNFKPRLLASFGKPLILVLWAFSNVSSYAARYGHKHNIGRFQAFVIDIKDFKSHQMFELFRSTLHYLPFFFVQFSRIQTKEHSDY